MFQKNFYNFQKTNKSIKMTSKGKEKPLKAPKKEGKDLDENDLAFKEKQKAEAKAKADMAKKLAKK